MKRITTKNRYMIWTGIWIITFVGFLSLLPQHYWFAVPLALWGIVGIGFVKDALDFYLIKQGQASFLHPYFEHMPLMVIVAVYAMYSLVSTGDWTWAIMVVAALAEAYIDWYQDRISSID